MVISTANTCNFYTFYACPNSRCIYLQCTWYFIYRHCDLPVRLLSSDFGVTCKTLQRAIHHLSQETGFHSHFATKFAYFRQPYPLFPSLEDSFISIVRPYDGKLKKGGFHLYLFPFDYPFNYIENYVVSSGISSKSHCKPIPCNDYRDLPVY